MSLLTKTLFIIINTVAVSIFILYLASRFTLLDGYQKIEYNDTRANILRVVNTFQSQSRTIIPTARAYAFWDEMYQFVQEPQQKFLDSLGLTPSLYATQNVNLIAILDVSYHPIFLKMYDIKTLEPIQIPNDLGAYLKKDSPLLKHSREDAEKAGVILLEGRPMFVASLGSLHTDFSGDPRGAVILGRFIDEKTIASLAEAMQFPVSAYRLDDSKMPSDVRQAYLELGSSLAAQSTYIKSLNEETIAGYTFIRTLEDKPALILKAVLPRHIYDQGLTSLRYFMTTTVIAGLGFIILIILLLYRFVLAPLTILSQQVSWIRANPHQSQRLHTQGDDELANLGIVINEMLEALEKSSDQKFRAIFDHAPYGIAINSLDGRYLDVNQACADTVGLSREEMLALRASDIARVTEAEVAATLEALRRHGAIKNVETTAKHRNGSLIHTLYSSVLLQGQGEARILSMTVDITDQKRAEAALRESEATLRGLFSAVPVGLVTAKDRVPYSVNERICEITGYSPAALLGCSLRQLFETDEEFQRVGHALYDRLWETGFSYAETRYRRADGTFRDVSLHAAPLQPDDPSAGAAVAIQDITEQKRTEVALRASRERLHNIANSVPGVVFQFYARPTGELGLSYFSTRAEELFGLTLRLEDAFPQFTAHVVPEDREPFLASIQQAVATASPWDFEGRFIKPAGDLIWFKGVSSPAKRARELVYTGIMLDITERKQTEEKLRAYLEYQRALLDNFPFLVWLKDQESRFLAVNALFAGTCGFDTTEALIGKTDLEVWPADLAEAYRADDRQVLASGEPKHVEELIEQEGQPRCWFETYKSPVRVGDRIVGTVGYARDITERKRAEEALRASEERYQTIFDASPVMFWLKDTKNNLVQINQAAATFENVKVEDLAGRSCYDVYPREQAEAFYQDDLQVIHSGKPKLGIIEQHTTPGSGRITWVETGKAPTRDNTGEITGVLAYALDITERKQVEEIIRGSAERAQRQRTAVVRLTTGEATADGVAPENFQRLTEAVSEALDIARASVWLLSEDRRALRCSDLFEAGPQRHSAGMVLHAGDYPQYFQALETEGRIYAMSARTDPRTSEFTEGYLIPLGITSMLDAAVCTGGRLAGVVCLEHIGEPREWQADEEAFAGAIAAIVAEMLVSAARQRAEGELRQYRDHLEDLVAERTAELRQAMNQLVQAEKLAALGKLVAGIAHELNTPVGNAVLAASTLADRGRDFTAQIPAGLTRSALQHFIETVREGSEILQRNLHRAADLISSFKQVAVDQSSYQRREFALEEVVHEIALALSPTLRRSPATLEVAIDPGLRLDSFPGPLGQVLMNLINNALVHAFHGRERGVIRIESIPAALGRVGLRVSDDGNGIAPAHLSRLFDPFFTTRLGQGGSGLGLHIVYNLVTGLLGGTITVHSLPGQGATFDLELPLIVPSAETRAEADFPGASTPNG